MPAETHAEVLAKHFPNNNAAESVVDESGFPPGERPVFNNAREFWRLVLNAATQGTEPGVDAIIRVAYKRSHEHPEIGRLLPTSPETKQWRPREPIPLRSTDHFAGRSSHLDYLKTWARNESDSNRVVALVAPGGTGKTALAVQVRDSLRGYAAAGVLIWSLEEVPQTEAFLREACEYFCGSAPTGTGTLLDHLQKGLRRQGNTPHLFILDGLEKIQYTGNDGPRGELKDRDMGLLLRWLAAGTESNSKALVTTQFPLADLDLGCGCSTIDLEDLEESAGISLLKARGVKGSDQMLKKLGDGVEWHALVLDVLGTYIGRHCGGDPAKAPAFDKINSLKSLNTEKKRERLRLVLTSYSARLVRAEGDLLARLALFPRGIGLDLLCVVAKAGGDASGSLAGYDESDLPHLLDKLLQLGLASRHVEGEAETFTARPFLRDFFKNLDGVRNPQPIYEVVRAKMAEGVDVDPKTKPASPVELDRYERLVEITLLAGKTQEAFGLYSDGVGGFKNLGWKLGENARGVRILSSFSEDGTPDKVRRELPEESRAQLITAWGLFAENSGDLKTARRAFQAANQLYANTANHVNLSITFQNLAQLELLAGCWLPAHEAATAALHQVRLAPEDEKTRDERRDHEKYSLAYLAAACAGLGRLAEATEHFQAATLLEKTSSQLYSVRGVQEAEAKFLADDRTGAQSQTVVNAERCQKEGWTDDLALCGTVLGHCVLPADLGIARKHLDAARGYATRSGHIEVGLRCHLLAAEIARHEQNFPLSLTEARAGIERADVYGFGRWSLDIRLELARIHLAAKNPGEAIEPATWVLTRSRERDCQYAWGIADGSNLLGIAHTQLGNSEVALDFLRQATAARHALALPEPPKTEAEDARAGN